MWILSWKTYKLSKFATFISIVGALTRYAAVLCITYGAIAGLFICGAIGVALHYLAEFINNGKWKKMVAKKGYTAKIAAGDVQAAIAVYNANPSKNTLDFISSYNPQVAQEVQAQIKK